MAGWRDILLLDRSDCQRVLHLGVDASELEQTHKNNSRIFDIPDNAKRIENKPYDNFYATDLVCLSTIGQNVLSVGHGRLEIPRAHRSGSQCFVVGHGRLERDCAA